MKTQSSLFRILSTMLLAGDVVVSGNLLGDYTLQDFAPDNYIGGSTTQLETMRQRLGIEGLAIEDFRELSVPNGPLKISGRGVGDVVPDGGNGWGETGTGFLLLRTGGTNTATIQVEGGTPTLGIGFSAFESDIGEALTAISINGGDLIPLKRTNLISFTFRSGIRNGYLIIKAGPGDPPIQQVEFVQLVGLDGFAIDYIAYVPAAPSCGFSSIRMSEVELCWPSISNTVYQVEYRSELTTNSWVPLFTNIVAIGKETCVTDKIVRGTPQRFYRLLCPNR